MSWQLSHSFCYPCRLFHNFLTVTTDKNDRNICKSAYAELWRISSIRYLLTVELEASKTLVCAILSVKLLQPVQVSLLWLPAVKCKILNNFKKVQNSAAGLFLKSRKHDHVQLLLCSYSWIPLVQINLRIKYKTNSLLQGSNFVHHRLISCLLPSTSDCIVYTHLLVLNNCSSVDGTRWPVKCATLSDSAPAFKSALKTRLFQSAYKILVKYLVLPPLFWALICCDSSALMMY